MKRGEIEDQFSLCMAILFQQNVVCRYVPVYFKTKAIRQMSTPKEKLQEELVFGLRPKEESCQAHFVAY